IMAAPFGRDTLPEHWSYGVCRDGRVFFINDKTRGTTWLHPRTGEPVNSGHMIRSDLPRGWEEGFTEEGASYFINHNLRTTTFRHPVTGHISSENTDFILQDQANLRMSKPPPEPRPPSMVSESSVTQVVFFFLFPQSLKPSGKVHCFGKRDHSIKRNPNVPVVVRGWLYKQDSSGMRLWKRKWFVLSDYCLFYYKDSREETVLGSIPLPSYVISPVGPEDHISRKYAFKACHTGMRSYIYNKNSLIGSQAEHCGMRTYFFSADTQEDMNGWIRAMNQAALMQSHGMKSHPTVEYTLPRRTPPLQPKSVMMETYQSLPKSTRHHSGGSSPPVPRNLPSDYKYAHDRLSHFRMSTDERMATKEGMVWQLYEWQQRQQFRHGSPTAPIYTGPDYMDTSAFRVTLEMPRSISVPPSPCDIPPPGHPSKFFSPRRPHTPADRVTVRPLDDFATVDTPSLGSPRGICSQISKTSQIERRSMPTMGYITHTVSAPSLHGKTVTGRDSLKDRPPRPVKIAESDIDVSSDKLESVLDVSHQQMELYQDQPAHAEKIAYQQKLLREDVVHIRADISQVSTEMENAWAEYSQLERDVDRLRSALQDQMTHSALSQVRTRERNLSNPVQLLLGLTGSSSRLNQSSNISSFVTLRRGLTTTSLKERPKSALERLYSGEPVQQRGRMSAEEQLERMKRHQKALVRERKRTLSQGERQASSSRASSTSKSVSADLGSWRREQDFDLQLLEQAVQGEERPVEHKERQRSRSDEWLTLSSTPMRELDLEPLDYQLDLSKELAKPQKVAIPERYVDMDPEEPLSPQEMEARHRKVERIKSILAKSSVQNIPPPAAVDKPVLPDIDSALQEQERIITMSYALASEASLKSKQVAGKLTSSITTNLN
uniref:Pleckstrin homology domain-containing family A member 7 n=1 Tax=Sinocyclocheilus grahami TaxID=75366 RepID=A0A672MPG6_SINGR